MNHVQLATVAWGLNVCNTGNSKAAIAAWTLHAQFLQQLTSETGQSLLPC